jgi:hypothetical protein
MNENTEQLDPLLPDQGPEPEKTKGAFRPTREQLVIPPAFLRGEQLEAWLQRDLEEAVGLKYIDRDGSQQPFAQILTARRPTPTPEPPPKPPADSPTQGELF